VWIAWTNGSLHHELHGHDDAPAATAWVLCAGAAVVPAATMLVAASLQDWQGDRSLYRPLACACAGRPGVPWPRDPATATAPPRPRTGSPAQPSLGIRRNPSSGRRRTLTRVCRENWRSYCVIAKSLPIARRKVFAIMIIDPIFPIFGEDLSFPEELAAVLRDFPRLTLRDPDLTHDHGHSHGRDVSRKAIPIAYHRETRVIARFTRPEVRPSPSHSTSG
jgi:hypothetical protein